MNPESCRNGCGATAGHAKLNQARGVGRERRVGMRLNHTAGSPGSRRRDRMPGLGRPADKRSRKCVTRKGATACREKSGVKGERRKAEGERLNQAKSSVEGRGSRARWGMATKPEG